MPSDDEGARWVVAGSIFLAALGVAEVVAIVWLLQFVWNEVLAVGV